MYYGFLGYPVSQTADITVLKATVIPVGEDQLPHLELTRRIVRRFNELYQPVFPEPHAFLSETPRLPGTDGTAKMSKSLGNSLTLDASSEEIAHSIKRAVTDPARLRKNDPGHPDICPIFAYHRAFLPLEAGDIREACERGSIGCTACKARITEGLQELYAPMRERRAYYAARPKLMDEILISGTERARKIARETLSEVREAMSLNYFADLG
ncbi:Tryptophan--tRNA ligase [compost metagenome]